MSAKVKIIKAYDILCHLVQKEFEILVRDQIQLESYSKKPKANTLLINASQSKLNDRFDHLTHIDQILKKLPDLLTHSWAEEKIHLVSQNEILKESLYLISVAEELQITNPLKS